MFWKQKQPCFALNERIWVTWDASVLDVSILDVVDQVVHLCVRSLASLWEIEVLAVYAWNEPSQRVGAWDRLRYIAANVVKPWLITDDFNEVLYTAKKLVGCGSLGLHSYGFKELVDALRLLDVFAGGEHFTRINNQSRKDRIYCKLHRAMGDSATHSSFPGVLVTFEKAIFFYHTMAYVSFELVCPRGRYPFKILNLLMMHHDFIKLVQDV